MNKKNFVEYFDVVDNRSKLNSIEKKAEREDKISWSILVEEIKQNVILDNNIKDFIYKIEKNNKMSELYFSTINIVSYEKFMKINDENNSLFTQLCSKMIEDNLTNIIFYNSQKNILYNDIKLIMLLFEKHMSVNNDNVEKLLNDKLNTFNIRRKIIKLYYKNKDLITYEDHIILNIKKPKDIYNVYNYINDSIKIYNCRELPKIIIIRENTKNQHINLFNSILNKLIILYKIIYKHISLNFKNQIGLNHTYVLNIRNKKLSILFNYRTSNFKKVNYYIKKFCSISLKTLSMYIFTLKQFYWIIYKFNKYS